MKYKDPMPERQSRETKPERIQDIVQLSTQRKEERKPLSLRELERRGESQRKGSSDAGIPTLL